MPILQIEEWCALFLNNHVVAKPLDKSINLADKLAVGHLLTWAAGEVEGGQQLLPIIDPSIGGQDEVACLVRQRQSFAFGFWGRP